MIGLAILIGLFLLVYLLTGLLMASMDETLSGKERFMWAVAWPILFCKGENNE